MPAAVSLCAWLRGREQHPCGAHPWGGRWRCLTSSCLASAVWWALPGPSQPWRSGRGRH